MAIVHYLGSHGQLLEQAFDSSLTIGRDPANDVVLSHEPSASRNHARITRGGDAYMLDDLGSRNGTSIEREGQTQRVDGGMRLLDGDVIVIGSLRIAFRLRPVDAPGETRVDDPASTKVASATKAGNIVVPPIAPAPTTSSQPGNGRMMAGVFAVGVAVLTAAFALALVFVL